jgi:hypothetical protein
MISPIAWKTRRLRLAGLDHLMMKARNSFREEEIYITTYGDE